MHLYLVACDSAPTLCAGFVCDILVPSPSQAELTVGSGSDTDASSDSDSFEDLPQAYRCADQVTLVLTPARMQHAALAAAVINLNWVAKVRGVSIICGSRA